MNLLEAILQAIDKWNHTFEHEGMWTGEDYERIIGPLHQALLELAKKEPSVCGEELSPITTTNK